MILVGAGRLLLTSVVKFNVDEGVWEIKTGSSGLEDFHEWLLYRCV